MIKNRKEPGHSPGFFSFSMLRTKHICYLSCLVAMILTHCSGRHKMSEVKEPSVKKDNSFERGKNLVFNICGQCHYDQRTQKFTGKRMDDLPGFMGKVYSANITATKNGILSRYTDSQLAWLLKTQTAYDGRCVPWMPRPNLADDDLNDIIIYLRSGDAPVSASDLSAGKTRMNVFGKMAMHFSCKPLPYKIKVKRPDEESMVDYGRYLVDNLACYHCHSKSIVSLDYMTPENSKGYMQGGMEFEDPYGNKVYSANLTPDKQTGIGMFTTQEFRNLLKEGKFPTGDTLHLPMQKFPYLTDKQADAIYLYLQTLPPKNHEIKRNFKKKPVTAKK